MARPTKYTKDLANKICEQVSKQSLRKTVKDKDIPSMTTILRWLSDEDKKEFRLQYEEACNVRTESMFEEINEIADNKKGEVQRDRLRVDTRKWYLSKMKPKKYGDKLDLTSDGKKLPTPIIPTNNVQSNNSNKKDNSSG